MSDLHEGLDGLQADMAAHQTRFVGEPTAEANRALAVAEVERIDRELADAQRRIVAKPDDNGNPLPSSEKREVDGNTYAIQRSETDTTPLRVASPMEHEWFIRATPRVMLLYSKMDTGPLGQASWHQRVSAVIFLKERSVEFKRAGHHEMAAQLDEQYMLRLHELLEASNAVFGDYMKDPGTKVMVG